MPTVTYDWTNIEDSFFVNNLLTPGNQTLPAIASVSGGSRYFTAWSEPDGFVEGRMIENDGDPTGDEFRVNSTTTNVQTDPSIVQLTGGNIIVTYTDFSVDPGGDLLARVLSSGGTLGTELIISNAGADDSDSDVAALADGGFVVTWTRDFGTDLDVRAAIFNADGSVRNSLVIIDSAADSASHTQVAGLANGNFVVVYEKEPSAGGDSEVWFQVLSSTGASVVAATLIDTFGSINEDIQVVALADGGFAVAYTDNGWTIDQTEITLRFYNSNGTARTGYIRVNSATTAVQENPSLTTLSNGYVVVSWSDGDALYYQAYTPTGVAVGTNFFAQGSVVEAEIAGLTGGLLANVRESTFSDGSGNSIRSQIDELTRTTTGDGTSENLVGDGLRDVMIGGGGNDTMIGGDNSDTYEVAEAGDVVFELANQGTDEVFAYANFTLPDNVENLFMNYGSQTYGYGNGLGNTIIGNSQANVIEGRGGADIIDGGLGGDHLDGGSGNDTITGGEGTDVLLGGTGTDTMIGGVGSDIYEVDNIGDSVVELAGQGTADNVFAYVNYTLPTNTENLLMNYGLQTHGYGNAGDNIIVGNDQANVIEGRAGYDTINGGGGSDLFIVNPGFGVDVINDFVAGAGTPDAVLFSQLLFSNFAQVMANSAQVGADTWIGDGSGNTVVLVGVQRTSLHADDFGFFAPPAQAPLDPKANLAQVATDMWMSDHNDGATPTVDTAWRIHLSDIALV
ncbi:MAG: hypothetical protein M3Q19_00425 [Pseudomonadota bacterium]|nr:hypothetical protein [Pseudomonadota bacterium]